jgi:hypothetical protein
MMNSAISGMRIRMSASLIAGYLLAGSIQPQLRNQPRVGLQLAALDALDEVGPEGRCAEEVRLTSLKRCSSRRLVALARARDRLRRKM